MDDVQDSQADENLSLRQALRSILNEGEQKVPSTTANIMASIRLEHQKNQPKAFEETEPTNLSSLPLRVLETPRPQQRKQSRYSIFAFAAIAAILIASFGLLGFVRRGGSVFTTSGSVSSGASSGNATTLNVTTYPPFATAQSNTWSAVVITYQQNGMTFIANYDPIASTLKPLLSSSYMDTTVYGVSHSGHQILYSIYDGYNTSYYIYPQATKNPVFTTPERGRSAIWSTDDRLLFISTAKGIMSVDTQTYNAKLVLPTLPNVTLQNYRDDGYLYFVQGNAGQDYATEGTFNRINISQNRSQQITSCTRGTNFWLSLSGVTVYYNCPEKSTDALYAVNSDGTNPHVFRSFAGSIIGYTEDGSPLTLENNNGSNGVTRRDIKTQQDTMLIRNVVPQGAKLSKENVAVAPYGHSLVASPTYNTGQGTPQQLWYSDLTTGSSQAFSLPDTATSAQVIGWDKLKV